VSGIPAWAVKGAKCVAVDRSFGDLDTWSGCSVGPSDIFTLLETKVEDGTAFCRARHDETGYAHEDTEWARLSRFRPLTSVSDDLEAHFTALLRAPQPEDA